MSVEEFIINNIVPLLTLASVAGGLVWQTKHNAKRFDRLDNKDDNHDDQLADHDKRIAVNEAKIEMQSGVLNDIKRKVDKLFDSLVNKGNP